MPRPTFEKPMPAMYCASAMPSRVVLSVPLSTAFFQVAGDEFDGLHLEHVAHGPCPG